MDFSGIHPLLYGSLTLGPLQAHLDLSQGADLICLAAELGVNLVDTAQCYQTYPYLRRAAERGAKFAVCTKTYAYDATGARQALAQAQDELDREHIDIFLLHEQESEHTLRGHAEALDVLLQARSDGIIGAVGLSTHHVAGALACARDARLDVLHPLINRRGLGIVDGTAEQMADAIAQAAEAGKWIFAMKALGGGHLCDSAAEALAWVRKLPGVSALAIGMQSPEEVRANAALIEGLSPAPADAAAIACRERTLFIEQWCNGCGACAARCPFGALTILHGRATVDPAKCLRCGYCAADCPNFCIKVL